MHIVKYGRDFTFPDYQPNYPREAPYRLEHIKLELQVYVYDKKIDGMATITLKSKRENLSAIELDAVDMDIIGVKSEGLDLDYKYDGEKIIIVLDKALKRDESKTIAIKYSAKPKLGLYFILPDKNHPDVVPQVWSQGEPEDNRYWIPIYDYPNNKATVELILKVPKEFTALGNGELVDVQEEGKWKTFHWSLNHPISPYLIAIAIGIFDKMEDSVDGLPLYYYVPKGRLDDVKRSFSRTPDIIRFYNRYFGVKYPYPQYTQVCVSEFIAGGMENTTITILTDRTLHDEKAHIDFESEPLVAHEAVHQWFGDLITMKDWGHLWINESFATYLQSVYTRHWKGDDEFIYELIKDLDRYLNEYGSRYSRPIVVRVYKYPNELFDAHSYPKGALVLHTLKEYIGEDKFRMAIKFFLERFKYSNADTEDLRKVFEAVADEDLEWFFDQYVYNAGHPVLEVSYKWDPDKQNLQIKFKQKQPDDCFEIYKFPLEFEITTEKETIKKKIWIVEKEQTLYIPLDAKPRYLQIDPNFKVFKVLNLSFGSEDLIELLKNGSTYMRILAARTLSKYKSSRVIQALKEQALKDSFWGVAYECIKAIGKIGLDGAKDALIELEKEIKNPKIRRAIMSALGNFKGQKVAELLARVIDDDSESYYVRSQAAQSLGKTKWRNAIDTLRRALSYPSHNHVITIGAIQGLGELGTEDAFKIILEYTAEEKPTFVRMAAYTALANFPEKKETKEKIIEAAKSFDMRIKSAVISAMNQMLDPKYLPILEALSNDFFKSIRRRAREAIGRIKRHMEKGTEYKKLQEEVEKIKEENRKLIDRLVRLEMKFV